MGKPWVGRVFLGAEWALFVGTGGRTPLHRHLAAKWVLGLERPIEIMSPQSGARRGRLLSVESGELHQVLADNERVGLFFRDARAFQAMPPLGEEEINAFVELCQRLDQGQIHAIDSVVGKLRHEGRSWGDARLEQALHQLSHTPARSLENIARDVGLSHSRLTHLFSAALGASPARYRRWRRLRVAAERLGSGASIVDAALDAGFSDSAHLSRTFVEMLGITPGTFQASEVHVV